MKVLCLFFGSEPELHSDPKEVGASPLHLHEVAEACLRVSPQIAVSDEAIFLEIGALEKIYRESTVVKRAQVVLQSFHAKTTMAVAEDIPTALAKARYKVKHKAHLPVSALNDYLSPFSRSQGLDKMIESMYRLGIHKLQQFIELTPQQITSRFGKEGLYATLCVREALCIPWPHFQARERLIEKREIESHAPLKNLQPLLFVLKGQLDRLEARLIGRHEKSAAIEVTIAQEKLSVVQEPRRSWVIELALPLRNSKALLPIIQERLECELREDPLIAPVELVQVEVLESVSAQAAQKDFFRKKEEQKEALAALVNRLCEKLGDEKSFLATPKAHHRPENTWGKTLEEPESLHLPFPERPLRVFKQPRPLRRLGPRLWDQQRQWQITHVDGPETLSGEWWHKAFHRDYFRVCTTVGEELWVYKEQGAIFLHGIFD